MEFRAYGSGRCPHQFLSSLIALVPSHVPKAPAHAPGESQDFCDCVFRFLGLGVAPLCDDRLPVSLPPPIGAPCIHRVPFSTMRLTALSKPLGEPPLAFYSNREPFLWTGENIFKGLPRGISFACHKRDGCSLNPQNLKTSNPQTQTSNTLHPTPYTLHPAPCTLHLHRAPYTLHTKPYTLHSNPFQDITSQTSIPKPQTLHPKT